MCQGLPRGRLDSRARLSALVPAFFLLREKVQPIDPALMVGH